MFESWTVKIGKLNPNVLIILLVLVSKYATFPRHLISLEEYLLFHRDETPSPDINCNLERHFNFSKPILILKDRLAMIFRD